MVDHGPSLKQLFLEGDESSQAMKAKYVKLFDGIEEKVKASSKGIKWKATLPDLTAKIAELLDIKIPDVLVEALKKLDKLVQYARESRQAPADILYLDLSEFPVNAELHPYLQIHVNGIPLKKVEVTVKLELLIKAIRLKIQNGRIHAIDEGALAIEGKVLLGDLVLADKSFPDVQLPGSIDFGEGIPIGV